MLRQRQPGVKALQKANKTLLNLQKEVPRKWFDATKTTKLPQ
jgi:hypothetical protein